MTALKVLARVGGEILWTTHATMTVVGDDSDHCDEVIAVRYPSAQAFLALALDPELAAALPHRDAGLERATIIRCNEGTAPLFEPTGWMAGAYWPRPWTCEDGGPLRRCCADGVPGLGIRPGERLEVTAAVDAFATDVLVRREPGRALRAASRHARPPAAGDPGRGLGGAARPRDARGDRLHAAAAGRRVLARRDRGARERRPAHGLRPLGPPPQPRPRGAGLPPAAGRAAAQLVRRARRRRARDEGLRRARGARALDRLGPGPRDAAAGGAGAAAARSRRSRGWRRTARA